MEITGQSIGGTNPTQTAPAQRKEAVSGQTPKETVVTQKVESTPEKTEQNLEQLVNDLNSEIKPLNTNIAFSLDDDTGEMVVTVKDSTSGEVIRQIPSEEAMELMAKMREVNGIIFDKKG